MTKIKETDFLEMSDRNQWIADNIMDGERTGEMLKGKFPYCHNYASWRGAGRIIEKMRERGWLVKLFFFPTVNKVGCQVEQTEHVPKKNVTIEIWAYADDPWTAIALAAGRAMEVVE